MKIVRINDNSGKLYYVGGFVRDEILGTKSPDADLIYEGNAIEWAKNEGFNITQINEPFGTVRIDYNRFPVDIASTRCETYPQKGHLPVVSNIGCSLSEDVKRRDFTVNSLYKSVKTGEIIDFTGGLKDIKIKKLRVLHDYSFIDDPTRIIRMLKFRMRFGFEPDEKTFDLQDKYLKNPNRDMSYKRIKKELYELFGYKGKTVISKAEAFKIFTNENIFKLITDKKPDLSSINFDNGLIEKSDNPLIFSGLIDNIEILPLTKFEKKSINDLNELKAYENFNSDMEIFNAFKNCSTETAILYGMLKNKPIALRYLNDLKNIKSQITGQDLIDLGFLPSKDFSKIFEKLQEVKFKNPYMTKEDEINFVNYLKI